MQLEQLIYFIEQSFETDDEMKLIEIVGKGYSNRDYFYEGVGSYNCIKTCNQWVNQGLKAAEIKTSIWSPFDSGVLYQVNKMSNKK